MDIDASYIDYCGCDMEATLSESQVSEVQIQYNTTRTLPSWLPQCSEHKPGR